MVLWKNKIWGKPEPTITFQELKDITLRENPTFLARKLKNMIKNPDKRDKMIKLMIQQIDKLS